MCLYASVLRDSPEEKQHSLGEGLEVVVPVDLCGVIQGNFPKHLSRVRGGGFSERCTERGLVPTHRSVVSSGVMAGCGSG